MKYQWNIILRKEIRLLIRLLTQLSIEKNKNWHKNRDWHKNKN